jgi:hypothetical protein
VDSSFKGTIQEVLAALYRGTQFRGAYIWHGISRHDPHPGTKHGYLQEVSVPPGDKWSTVTYEYSMRGSWTSPTGYRPDGSPIQIPIRDDADPLHGINRDGIAPRYRDATVRDAIMEANQQAAVDYARHIAGLSDPHSALEAGVRAFRSDTYSWWHDVPPAISGPVLMYLDSFVTGGGDAAREGRQDRRRGRAP